MKYYTETIILTFLLLFSVSCKKEKEGSPPEISFKSGGNFIDGNADVSQGTVYFVGVIGDKTKKDLRSFEVNVSYDGDDFEQFESYLLKNNEREHFEHDVKITTRNEQGSEKWQFELSDIDGNTAVETIQLNVN